MFWGSTFLNQILYSAELPAMCSLYHSFWNTRGCFPCIVTTYGRCPLIQADWPCIAGRTAITCEQHFGLGLSCFPRETPNQDVCLARVNIMRPSHFHLTDTRWCSLLVVSFPNLTTEKVTMNSLTDFCSAISIYVVLLCPADKGINL